MGKSVEERIISRLGKFVDELAAGKPHSTEFAPRDVIMPDPSKAADVLTRPRRNWFQYRLRTLLIGVVLVAIPCAWVGWQIRLVHLRNAKLQKLATQKLGQFYISKAELFERGVLIPPQPSRLRQLFGDMSQQFILLDADQVSDDEASNIKRLFPEAVVAKLPRARWSLWEKYP